jgi:flagellar motor protein MotB
MPMKNLILLVLSTIFLSGCSIFTPPYKIVECKYANGDVFPVTVYSNPNLAYENVATSYEGELKGLKTSIKDIQIGDLILKKIIIELTDKLDQKSIRNRDKLAAIAGTQQTFPCDKDTGKRLAAYLTDIKEDTNEMGRVNIEINKNTIDPKKIESSLKTIVNKPSPDALIKEPLPDSNKPDGKLNDSNNLLPNSSHYDANFIILSSLFFQSGSVKLTEDARQKLFHIGTYLQNIKNGIIYLVGNSDPRLPKNGKFNNNYNLSVQRAKVVGDELKNGYGIRNYKILGLSDNLTTTKDGSSPSLPYDRRVDIYISQGNQLLDLFAVSL